MFCENCGQEIKPGNKFCNNCGLKVDDESGAANVSDETSGAGAATGATNVSVNENVTSTIGNNGAKIFNNVNNEIGTSKRADLYKKTSKNLIISVAGAVAAMVVIIILAISMLKNGRTIDLADYISVEFNGYDGYGTAIYQFDSEKFEADYGEKLKFKNSKTAYFVPDAVEFVTYSIEGELDKKESLKNGDSVEFSWDIKDGYFNSLNRKIKLEDKTFEVEGLEKIEEFDAFEYIDVQFSGLNPNGVATITMKDNSVDFITMYDFEIMDNSKLSNGDKVTVKINYDNTKILKFGKVPSKKEKEYKVEGLSEYIKSVDQIPEDLYAQMQQQGIDTIKTNISNVWIGHKITYTDAKYIGNYFITSKFDECKHGNVIILVYKVNASLNDDAGEPFSYYYYIEYSDIVLNGNSIDLNLSNYKKLTENNGITAASGNIYYYDGYEKLVDLETNEILPYSENYTYTKNITE